MLAFFNCKQYHLSAMYQNIFSSKVDMINLVRLIFTSGSEESTIELLRQYDLSTNIMHNILGEVVISSIFLLITILMKVASIFINSEKIRRLKTKLRAMWNGLFIAFLPRIATFTGIHLRLSEQNPVNGVFAAAFLAAFVFFFIALLLQIRNINSKIEYLEESKMEIGLASRIDINLPFQFDCLSYSILYYPIMIYLRLLAFFLPLGAAYDVYYFSFGGPILSQLVITMLEISCPQYTRKRDKVVYPFVNFFLMLAMLCTHSLT